MKSEETIKEKRKNYSPKAIAIVIAELAAAAGAGAGAGIRNALSREACPSTKALLDGIMEELKNGNNNVIGVLLGPDNLEKIVKRRVEKDASSFGAVVMTTVSNEPNYRKIQDDIAKALKLSFDGENIGVKTKKSKRWLPKVFGSKNAGRLNDEIVESRARRLRQRMLDENKILVILFNVCSNGLDLDKVGIPYGTCHAGCKLLLTSASEDVLSNHMSAQRIFRV